MNFDVDQATLRTELMTPMRISALAGGHPPATVSSASTITDSLAVNREHLAANYSRESMAIARYAESLRTADATPVGSMALPRIELEALEELREYRHLKPAWDGYSGSVFAGSLLSRAEEVIQHLCAFLGNRGLIPNELTPGPAADGSVDIEVTYEGRVLILSLLPNQPDSISVYFGNNENETEELAPFTSQSLEAWYSRLVAPAAGTCTLAAA